MKTFLADPLRATLGAAVFALAASSFVPAHAALTLVNQPTLLSDEAAANGTLFQTNLLAETFSFTGTAHTLSWWGTEASTLSVQLYAGSNLAAAPVFSQTGVAGVATADTIVIKDVQGVEQSPTVYRFTVDLGNLAAGGYTLTVVDTTADDDDGSWYWLLGSGGEGESLSIDDDGVQVTNLFDLSLQVEGERGTQVPEPATLALVAAAALAGWPRRRARPVAA